MRVILYFCYVVIEVQFFHTPLCVTLKHSTCITTRRTNWYLCFSKNNQLCHNVFVLDLLFLHLRAPPAKPREVYWFATDRVLQGHPRGLDTQATHDLAPAAPAFTRLHAFSIRTAHGCVMYFWVSVLPQIPILQHQTRDPLGERVQKTRE